MRIRTVSTPDRSVFIPTTVGYMIYNMQNYANLLTVNGHTMAISAITLLATISQPINDDQFITSKTAKC